MILSPEDVLYPEKDLSKLLQRAENLFGPAREWQARCFEIASKFVSHDLVEGVAVYGHFRGHVADGTLFADRVRAMGFVQHGWVLLHDGRIFDPTRWVFEGETPYLHLGPATEEYDEGGNRNRFDRIGYDPPDFDTEDEHGVHMLEKEDLDTKPFQWLERKLQLDRYYADDGYEPGTVCHRQLFWIAQLPPSEMDGHAAAIYRMLFRLEMGGLIPIDNRLKIERETNTRFGK